MRPQDQRRNNQLNSNQVFEQSSYTVFDNEFVANNRKFAVIYLILQGCIIALYGIFIRPTAHRSILDNGLFTVVGAALLILIGFGLFFSYLNKLRWSGIGFTFLITALTFQLYFLINAFWTKVPIQASSTDWSQTYVPVYLSDENGDVTQTQGVDTYGNTAVGALKCALALVIAFNAIGGRGGPLEAIIIVIFGTVTYELNRQILSRFSVNQGGSATIFEFGGFMGLAISLILYCTKHNTIIQNNRNYRASEFSVTMALVGAAFIWVFFPVLNMDIPNTIFVYSNSAISTIVSIASCVVATISMSLIANGRVDYRDLITAPILGGVIVGSSATHIYNPAEAIIMGVVASFFQVLFNRAQKSMGNNPKWTHSVFFLFGLQGLFGSLASTAIRAINKSSAMAWSFDNLNPKYEYGPLGQLTATAVTLGIALGTGLIVGLILLCVTKETRQSLYDDHTYWDIYEDGLSYKIAAEVTEYVESEHEIVQAIEPDRNHQYL